MRNYIKKGDSFVCIKTVKMIDDGCVAYKKGFIYFSEIDNGITDIQSDISHCWNNGTKKIKKEFKKHFIKIKK